MPWRDPDDRYAWIDLTECDSSSVWDRVSSDLGFEPARMPAFRDPPESITWELRDVPEQPWASVKEQELAVAPPLREALDVAVGPDRWVDALDWEHDCYRFYPSRATAPVCSWLRTFASDGWGTRGSLRSASMAICSHR